MNKKLFTTAALILCGISFLYAQVDQGNWLFAGSSNIEFNSTKEKYKYGSTTSDYQKCSDFDFRPVAAYFVIDKLPVGIFMDLSLDKTKMLEYDNEYSYTDIVAGPFARYYVTDLDGFMPYAEAAIGLGGGKYKSTYAGNESTSTYSLFAYRLGVGGTYFVLPAVGIDLFLGYQMEQYKYKNDGGTEARSDTDEIYKDGGLAFNIGFVISIGK